MLNLQSEEMRYKYEQEKKLQGHKNILCTPQIKNNSQLNMKVN